MGEEGSGPAGTTTGHDPGARARAWPIAAVAAGGLLLAIDLLLATQRAGPAEGRALLIPALALLPLLVILLLPAFLGDRVLALPMALAGAGLGQALARGPRAATMPFAAWWWLALAILGLGAAVLLARRARRPGAGRRALLLGLPALAVFVVAALTQRGRYQEVRLFVDLIVFLTLAAVIRPLGARLSRSLAALVVGLAAAGGGLGLGLALIDDGAAAWAMANSSLAETLVAELRARVLPELVVEDGRYRHRPVLGSALGLESRARLERAGGPPRGVLLVTIDAMRADLLDRLVGGRPVAPGLEALATGGMRFDRAYAPAPMTQFSVFAMLSGWYSSQYLSFLGGFDGCPLITDRLRAAGVETRACYPKGMLTVGLDHFERLDLGFGTSSLHPWDDLTIDETFARLRPEGRGRWFSYLHLMLPHHPYDGADPAFVAGGSEFERFAAEVRTCDHYLGLLLERFRAAGLDDMWLIVSADHGEEFGEHGAYRHSTQVFEESVHVPLVVLGRGVIAGRHAQPVSLVDLAPTLHQLFDLPRDGVVYAGRSLLPLLCGLDDPERPRTVLVENPPVAFNRANTRAGLVGPRWKLIADERSRRLLLYDLDRDPAEREDLAAREAEEARRLYAELVARRRFGGQGATVFGTMLDFLGLLDDTVAKKGVGGVLSAYEWMKGLAPEDELRVLAFFVEFPDPAVTARLDQLLAGRPEPEIRLVLALIHMAGEPTDPAAFAAALAAGEGLRSPALDDALLALAARRKLSAEVLLARDREPGPLGALSRLRYRIRLEGRADGDAAAIEEALATSSAWRADIALEAALFADLEPPLDRLIGAAATGPTRELRRAALRLLAASTEEAAVAPLLVAARGRDLDEASIAALGLVRRSPLPPGLVAFVCARAGAELEGLVAAEAPFFALTADRASAPLPRPEGAGRVAVFLRFEHRPGRTIRLRVGEQRFELYYPPLVPGEPVILDLDPAERAERIEIEVEGGAADDLRYAGSLGLPAD